MGATVSRKKMPVPLEELSEAKKIQMIHNLREILEVERRKCEESLRGMRVRLDAVEWALASAHVAAARGSNARLEVR